VTLKKNMRVRFHHAGQARQVREIDDLCACQRREFPHLLDPVALDGDDHVRLELVGSTVKQRTAMDVCRARHWWKHEFYRTRSIVILWGYLLSQSKPRQQREKTKREGKPFQHGGNS